MTAKPNRRRQTPGLTPSLAAEARLTLKPEAKRGHYATENA